MTIEVHDLQDRIERLERSNRRLRIAGVLALAVLGGAVALGMGQSTRPQEIEASAFKLIDDDGRTRATLAMIKTGPRLSLFDDKGQTRLSLTASPLGPSFLLFDDAQETRLGATVTRIGPSFQTWNEKGEPAWRAP